MRKIGMGAALARAALALFGTPHPNIFPLHEPPPVDRLGREMIRGRASTRVTTYFPGRNGKRERQRRILQGAHICQRLSHKTGTVQPRHIFGGEP